MALIRYYLTYGGRNGAFEYHLCAYDETGALFNDGTPIPVTIKAGLAAYDQHVTRATFTRPLSCGITGPTTTETRR
jgi:hypothetical protein